MIRLLTIGLTASSFAAFGTATSCTFTDAEPLPDGAWAERVTVTGSLKSGSDTVELLIAFSGESSVGTHTALLGYEWNAGIVRRCEPIMVGPQKMTVRVVVMTGTLADIDGGELQITYACQAPDVLAPAMG